MIDGNGKFTVIDGIGKSTVVDANSHAFHYLLILCVYISLEQEQQYVLE